MFVERRIKEAVEKLMRKHRTSDPEIILKNMKNVDLKFEALSDTLNGYYLYISEKKQIVRAHEGMNKYTRQYVLFHELAHCILKHRGTILFDCINTISNRKEEYEADLFAAYFFILHNGISRENINDFTIPERARALICRFL